MSDKTKEQNKPYKNIEVEEKGENSVEISGEVKVDFFKENKEKVLDEMQEEYEADGFRKGNVPKDVIEEQVGEEHILNEAAQKSLNKIYPSLIQELDLKIMSRPNVHITKLAAGNPLGFKINVGTVPEVKLPAYKDIAKSVREEAGNETKEVEVSDEEVEQVAKYVQAQHAQKDEDSDEEAPGQVPELTDEFVQEIGDFETVEEFKEKMKENIKREKENKSKQNLREEIAKRLVDESDIEIPEITVKTQLASRLENLEKSLENRDMSFDEYLEQSGKDEEEFLNQEKENIENQIKTRLIFEKIAEEEEIEPDEEQLEQQTKAMMQYQPDANPEVIKNYVKKSLINTKVIEMLEGDESEE